MAEERARRDGPKDRWVEDGRESGGRRVRPSQTRRRLSEESQARRRPSGENERAVTEGVEVDEEEDGAGVIIARELGALSERGDGVRDRESSMMTTMRSREQGEAGDLWLFTRSEVWCVIPTELKKGRRRAKTATFQPITSLRFSA